MDDFEEQWKQLEEEDYDIEPDQRDLEDQTPAYQIKNAHSRYRLLASLLMVYFHVTKGESMANLQFDQGEKDFQYRLE